MGALRSRFLPPLTLIIAILSSAKDRLKCKFAEHNEASTYRSFLTGLAVFMITFVNGEA